MIAFSITQVLQSSTQKSPAAEKEHSLEHPGDPSPYWLVYEKSTESAL